MKMKKLFLHIALFFSLFCFSQNEQLAQYYFDKGDFEKARISFEELVKETPQNGQYFQRTIDCYQQLQLFNIAEKALRERLAKYKQGKQDYTGCFSIHSSLTRGSYMCLS